MNTALTTLSRTKGRRMARMVSVQEEHFGLCKKFLIDSVSYFALRIRNYLLENNCVNGDDLIKKLNIALESAHRTSTFEDVKSVVDLFSGIYEQVQKNRFELHKIHTDIKRVYMANEVVTLTLMFGLSQHGHVAFEQFEWAKWPKYVE